LLGNLGASLMKDSGATPEAINKHIATHERPLMVSSSLLTEDFSEHGADLLSTFIKFWNGWPNLPTGRTVINCVCIKHQRPETRGFFQRRKLQRIASQLRAYINNLDWAFHPGVSGVVLNELEAIRRSDVDHWSRHEMVRAVRRIQDQEIRLLFTRADLCTKDGRIPMEKLAPQLKALLSGKNFNRKGPS
jgi:hypothetical protein